MTRHPAASESPSGLVGAPPDGFVRVGPLTNLPALLDDLGHVPAAVFAQAGFTLEAFSDPDAELSFVRASGLLARCVAATGCDHLGLLLGARTPPSSLGIPGFMLRAAPDVGTALAGLVRYLDLHDRGGLATLTDEADLTRFEYVVRLCGVEATEQIHDLALSVFCVIMRAFCEETWTPSEVHLARRAPRQLAPYRQFFRAALHFDADRNAVSFPTRLLSQTLATADPLLFRHLEREAIGLHGSPRTSLAGRARRLLRQSLAGRQCTAAGIAAQLGMHERTLNRRLREERTSFREELASVRFQIARQLLADTALPLPEIAAALGYGDSTAFIRAFKEWAGLPPAEWRRRRSA